MQCARGAGGNEAVPRPRVAYHWHPSTHTGCPPLRVRSVPWAGASRIANKWGHSGVILGSFWGHFGSFWVILGRKKGYKNISTLGRATRPWSRPHGLGGPGGPLGTCWARCWSPWTDGAHAPASLSTSQRPGSIFSHGANSRAGGQLHHTQFGVQHVGQLATGDPGGALTTGVEGTGLAPGRRVGNEATFPKLMISEY